MAEKKKQSHAEKAASQAKGKSTNNKSRKSGDKKQSQPAKTDIPVRVISSLIFVSLFVLLLVLFINNDGAIMGGIDAFIRGLIGGVGFFVSIPVLLYLFIIHAFRNGVWIHFLYQLRCQLQIGHRLGVRVHGKIFFIAIEAAAQPVIVVQHRGNAVKAEAVKVVLRLPVF